MITITTNYNDLLHSLLGSQCLPLRWMPNEESFTNESLNSRMNSLFITWGEPTREHYLQQLVFLVCSIHCHGNLCYFGNRWLEMDWFVTVGTLPNRCSAMDYSNLWRKLIIAGRWLAVDCSSFQASCRNIVTFLVFWSNVCRHLRSCVCLSSLPLHL
jgi:hypothetical protein